MTTFAGTRPVAGVDDALFAAAAVRPADRVLDVGCGAGGTTRIAARLAARGHVVGVDVSAPLLRRAQELTAAQKIRNATYLEADAQVHPFPACGYDVIVSRCGVMSFADHAAAFRNLERALMPGGRLAFVCPGPDADAAAAMDPLCDPDRIRAVLAGWVNVEITPVALDGAEDPLHPYDSDPGVCLPGAVRLVTANRPRRVRTAVTER